MQFSTYSIITTEDCRPELERPKTSCVTNLYHEMHVCCDRSVVHYTQFAAKRWQSENSTTIPHSRMNSDYFLHQVNHSEQTLVTWIKSVSNQSGILVFPVANSVQQGGALLMIF